MNKNDVVEQLIALDAMHIVDGKILCYDSDGVFKQQDERYLQGVVKTMLNKQEWKLSTINEITKLWVIDLRVQRTQEQMTLPNNMINFKNGILDIEKGVLYSHSPMFKSTAQLNVEYHPSAQCPSFLHFLSTVFDTGSEMLRLQELFGATLTRQRIDKLFILFGKPRSGKSTVADVLAKLLGYENVTHIPMDKLGDRFNTADLRYRLANISSDMPDKEIVDAGMIKGLTGGDRIKGEGKFEKNVYFNDNTKIIGVSNHLVRFKEDTSAIEERIEYIVFKRKVPLNERDIKLLERLENELSGIANWALTGLRRLNNSGMVMTKSELDKYDLVEIADKSNDAIMEIVEQNFTRGSDLSILTSELHDMINAQSTQSLSPQKLKKCLLAHYRGVHVAQPFSDRRQYYIGIGTKTGMNCALIELGDSEIPILDFDADADGCPFIPPTPEEYDELLKSSDGYDASQYDDEPILDYEFPEVVVDIPTEINFDGRHFS